LCDRVIVSIRSRKLSFHDLKSQGKTREFNYRRVSALEVIFNVMRSINPRFTYLLTCRKPENADCCFRSDSQAEVTGDYRLASPGYDDSMRGLVRRQPDAAGGGYDDRGVRDYAPIPRYSTGITGCAVAQHCCKGGQSFQWESPNFDLPYFPNPSIFPYQNLHRRLRPAYLQMGKIWLKSVHRRLAHE